MDIQSDLEEKVNWLLNNRSHSMGEHIGIRYEKLYRNEVVAFMPVDQRTKQPFGLLHGGASVVLAESLASVGAWLNIDENLKAVVGIEINANHMRAVKEGEVRGQATPLHRGAQTHVWQINIHDPGDHLVCSSRCTLAIINRKD
jgi:1,4-dihydroxy-2-naphthoyl-CoA hydrolase